MGMQIHILNATTIGEIDAAFAVLARDRPDALFVAGDTFLTSRRVQIATLAARDRISAAYSTRDAVAAGGRMSYGADLAAMYRQVGVYSGNVLKGAKPADLPVVQSPKFELVINLTTAKSLGLTIPETLLATADEVAGDTYHANRFRERCRSGRRRLRRELGAARRQYHRL
jgi:putative ABC transport system substrate-binding protein